MRTLALLFLNVSKDLLENLQKPNITTAFKHEAALTEILGFLELAQHTAYFATL